MNLTVVIPAFNEERTLGGTVTALHEKLEQAAGEVGLGDFEIVVVNDGSTDGTLTEARRMGARYRRCRLVTYEPNCGKGYALRRGFATARGELVAFIDADGEITPQALLDLLACQRRLGVSAVVGRKVVSGPRPWQRRLMTWGVRQVGQAFRLPISDSQTGVKVFRRADVRALVDDCQENGYLFDLELLTLAHRAGLAIRELAVEVRVLRESRITMTTGLANLGRSARLWLELERSTVPRSPSLSRGASLATLSALALLAPPEEGPA